MHGSVSVVIVTFNGRLLLESCLRALFSGTRLPEEVIVVDNASTDGTVRWLQVTYPSIVVVPCTVNLGFAAANNRGIERARSDYIFTLNNDTEIEPDALATLCRTLDDAEPHVGAAMSTMVFAQRPEIVACAGLEVFANGVVRDSGIGGGINRSGVRAQVFGPSAGAALYRRMALDDVGLFDPALFMYLEDADLAWRLRLRQWQTLTVPGAIVRHAVSATAGYGSPRKAYYLARNRWWCLVKNVPEPLLRRDAMPIARYDAAAVAYAIATGDRASLAGRRDALADLLTIRNARARIQSRVTERIEALEPWIATAPALRETLKERRMIAAYLT